MPTVENKDKDVKLYPYNMILLSYLHIERLEGNIQEHEQLFMGQFYHLLWVFNI